MIVNFTLLQATVFFPSFFLNASFSFPKAIHNSLLFKSNGSEICGGREGFSTVGQLLQIQSIAKFIRLILPYNWNQFAKLRAYSNDFNTPP